MALVAMLFACYVTKNFLDIGQSHQTCQVVSVYAQGLRIHVTLQLCTVFTLPIYCAS